MRYLLCGSKGEAKSLSYLSLDELKSLCLSGLGEGDAKLDVSVEVLDFTVTDVNAFNCGESKTSSKGSVDGINVVLYEGVEFSSKSS